MSDTAITFAPLTVADAQPVAGVLRTAFDARLPWLSGRHTPEQDLWFVREQVFGKCDLVGAYAGARLVGFIAMRSGWIDQLYVLPDMQGRGIGTALVGRAQARFARLNLWAFQRNSGARAFYAARGFQLVRETDGRENGEPEGDALYLWERG